MTDKSVLLLVEIYQMFPIKQFLGKIGFENPVAVICFSNIDGGFLPCIFQKTISPQFHNVKLSVEHWWLQGVKMEENEKTENGQD